MGSSVICKQQWRNCVHWFMSVYLAPHRISQDNQASRTWGATESWHATKPSKSLSQCQTYEQGQCMIYILLVITDHFMVKKNNTYFLYISAISDILVHVFGQLYLTQKWCTIVSFMSYFIYYLYTEISCCSTLVHVPAQISMIMTISLWDVQLLV